MCVSVHNSVKIEKMKKNKIKYVCEREQKQISVFYSMTNIGMLEHFIDFTIWLLKEISFGMNIEH